MPPAGPASDGPPPTRREDVVDVVHGVAVPDPYRWLEDAGDPEVVAWMDAQDRHARARLSALPGLGRLRDRLAALFYVDAVSAPVNFRGRLVHSRRAATQEKSVVYWRQGRDGADRVLLDPNAWADDGSAALGAYVVSPDGRHVAYTRKRNNSDESTLHVREIDTGQEDPTDAIEGAKYAWPSWTPDGRGFYYTWVPVDPGIPAAERPGLAEVRYHRLGRPAAEDEVIREATRDPGTFQGVHVSRDGRWLVATVSHGWRSHDVRFRDARDAASPWRDLVVGRDATFRVTAWGDRLYVHTNDGAPRGRVLCADPAAPEPSRWQEIVPERPDANLEDVGIVGGHLVLSYLRRAASHVEIRDLDGRHVRDLELPAHGSAFGPWGHEDEDEAHFGFTTFTMPWEIHAISMATGATRLWHRHAVPVDAADYEVRQVAYPSRDGTEVTMFLVSRRGLARNGDVPTLLTGYGGFQVAHTPAFTASLFPWLDAGGMYAVAQLRGGGEYGEDWHRDGMLERKQNTFDDAIAAAEFLVREGYTRKERLAVAGGSNGGLLVGALVTQRPELFRAVVCAVPLLDMLRYHHFGSGRTWVGEYGSPDDPAQFRILHAYSPYHRLNPGTPYPPVLMLSADSDDRVDPLHARKFTAALQHATTGGPVLLRIERNAGHGGADLVRSTVDREAEKWAFLMAELGVTPEGA